ncbi:uncharacterized protein [Venturia canescens]|uniref:uncharacterized protein isoform X4 n=1 Tax=Venturia canescens TaxID=32260 RepID=UPI001C9C8722|nr:uncharacterized protein LOC122412720 isoform X4 [Venturia canescens]
MPLILINGTATWPARCTTLNFGEKSSSSGDGGGSGRTGIGSYGIVAGSVGSTGGVGGSSIGPGGPRLGIRPSIGTAAGRGPIRRSREFGYYPMEEHPSHAYRTHLFLSPPTGAPDDNETRGLGPGPRRNSGPHVIKWGGGGGNPANNNNPPQQSATNANANANLTSPGTTNANKRKQQNGNLGKDSSEPPTPTASRQHAPIADKKRSGSPLSVLEVEDPKQCVLAHFMTPLEPLDPLVESPIARPLVLQRDTAAELIAEIAPSASQSILLTNMERNADFPFITYYLINKHSTDPSDFYQEVQCAALRKFDPRDLRYAASHTLDLFNEVATIARPPLEPPGGRPPIPSTGYIVSIFKVFEGDDGLKFEQNWLYWTGARMIYRYLPKSVGLKRITLHKSMSQGDKMYLLICECSQLQDNLSAAAILLPALRARLCGYTGLYRPSVCF